MDKLNPLLMERATKVAAMRAMVEGSEARGEVTAEDTQAIERITDEIRGLDSRIENLNALRTFEGTYEVEGGEGQATQTRQTEISGGENDEYRDAFMAMLRGEADVDQIKALRRGFVNEESRDQTKGVAAKGGYIAPDEFQKVLLRRVEELSIMRQIIGGASLTTAHGNTLTFSREDAQGAAAWLDESAAFVATDDTFEEVSIEAWKAGRLVKATIELVEDSFFAIDTYLANSIGTSLAKLEQAAFVNGDGVSKPRGFILDAAVGVTSTEAAADVCSGDEVIDLMYSIAPSYRNGAEFVVADLAVKALRKLKDADGRYLWQDGLRTGEPTTLLGKPVHVEANMPVPAASAKPIAFGNFREGYMIRDVSGVRMVRLNERYIADEGKIGFLGWKRVDGKLIDTDSVKVLVQAAA